MCRPRVRVVWWVGCVASLATAVFGGPLEDATGLPVGPGSLVLLLMFAAWRAVDWYVDRLEHPVYPMAPTGPEQQTVDMALQRVAARRTRPADPTAAASEPTNP